MHRNVATWCENHNIPLHLWGRMEGNSRWQKYVKEDTSIILEGPMPNDELPDIYRASKIILNDHYDDMREEGFINNRILEALSCGRPVLSDWCEEFERLFGDSLVYYHDEEDFLEKLKWLEEHSEEQKEKVLAIWPKLQKEYSFGARVDPINKDIHTFYDDIIEREVQKFKKEIMKELLARKNNTHDINISCKADDVFFNFTYVPVYVNVFK